MGFCEQRRCRWADSASRAWRWSGPARGMPVRAGAGQERARKPEGEATGRPLLAPRGGALPIVAAEGKSQDSKPRLAEGRKPNRRHTEAAQFAPWLRAAGPPAIGASCGEGPGGRPDPGPRQEETPPAEGSPPDGGERQPDPEGRPRGDGRRLEVERRAWGAVWREHSISFLTSSAELAGQELAPLGLGEGAPGDEAPEEEGRS